VSYRALGDEVERLRESLALLDAHPVGDDLHVSMRNSVLLSFMFTFGLIRPIIERFLVSLGEEPLEVEGMSFARLIRSANERGVLQKDVAAWSDLRDARNRIAHVYSESGAQGIIARVPQFLEEVLYLHAQVVAKSEEL